MFNKVFHWKRDHHDARDFYAHTCSAFKLMAPEAVPASADLRNLCSPIFDQGQLGSCTGNALTGAMEFLENKAGEFKTADKFVNLSRLFVYYNERSLEGDVQQDNGAQISTGIKTLNKIGICTEANWPYVIHRFATKPTDAAYSDAGTKKTVAYARVDRSNGIDGIKQVLASGYPIVFGFTVFSGFESDEVAKTGVLNMPAAGETNQGGHAVMMVGYDDASQRVTVRNSWGTGWGQQGYFTMPYEYVISRDLANDFWTITK